MTETTRFCIDCGEPTKHPEGRCLDCYRDWPGRWDSKMKSPHMSSWETLPK